MTPAIIFNADGYVLDGAKLMGRQSAGAGFLRAAVRAHAGEPIHAVTATQASAQAFARLVLGMDPAAQPGWIQPSRLGAIGEVGLLYRPDTNIVTHARERMRIGAQRYSVCGVTHTLASHAAMDSLAEMVAGPVTPWDAVICTSTAARTFVDTLLAAQDDYLAWRFGQPLAAPRPQLPVIPLGVHTDDFASDPAERSQARAALGLAEDDVALLFAGRLTFSAKVHPFQTYAGLERTAQATGRKLVLIHAGQFANPAIEVLYRRAVSDWCPSVRVLFVEGGDFQAFAATWRAADVFVSLSDNVQETFGITPVEAMASGLPVLVSDWNGYKDTVRDGVDGFRIPTWAPEPGAGMLVALDHETGATTYDYFLSRTSTTASVDAAVFQERLTALVESPELRRRMGEAGRARAQAELDWAVVYRSYQALWRELAEIRRLEAGNPALRLADAPRGSPARPDPFTAFAHYPTRHISSATRVRAASSATAGAYEALTRETMLATWSTPSDLAGRTLEACAGAGATVAELAARLGERPDALIERLGRLAKMELVMLSDMAEG